VIGYTSWQDEATLPILDYLLCHARKHSMEANKSFIDQACSVRMAAFFSWARQFTLKVPFPSRVCIQMNPSNYAEG